MGFGWQGVGQLAAEAYAQGLGLQAVFHGGEGGVVIAAGLSEAVAAFVDADDGDQQQAELVDADFFAGKLGDAQFGAAAFAFLFGAVGRVGGEPHPPRVRFNIGQVEFCAAFLCGTDKAIQTQFLAYRPIHADFPSFFDVGFEQAADGFGGGIALVCAHLGACAAELFA